MKGVELEIVGAGTNAHSNSATVRVLYAPSGFNGQKRGALLNIHPLPPTSSKPVKADGEELYRRLGKNAEVIDAIKLLTAQPVSDMQPLYFRILDHRAASLPWETLFVGNDFLSLQPNWPIARISEGYQRGSPGPQLASTRLKVMSIMSAVGAPALGEWDGLIGATRYIRDRHRASQDGLDVDLNVLVGESQLEQKILGAITSSDSISVATIPRTVSEIRNKIKHYKPQVLHLFCHGSVSPGKRRLHFGTISDWLSGQGGVGSLNLSLQELASAATKAGVWLVVINACKGAAATADAYSLADDLVRFGVPAAIGHREAIAPIDANRFSTSFFVELYDLLARKIAAGGRQEIEWAETFYAPRADLCARYGPPETNDRWSIPLLHVRVEDFLVKVVNQVETPESGQTSAELGAADTIAEAIGRIHHRPDVSDDIIRKLREILGAESAQVGEMKPRETDT